MARAAWGCLLLAAPFRVERAIPQSRIDKTTIVFARVLGARQLVQAVLIRTDATPNRILLGAGVDALHAATMIALAVTHRQGRRLATANALTATALAATGVIDACVTHKSRN